MIYLVNSLKVEGQCTHLHHW